MTSSCVTNSVTGFLYICDGLINVARSYLCVTTFVACLSLPVLCIWPLILLLSIPSIAIESIATFASVKGAVKEFVSRDKQVEEAQGDGWIKHYALFGAAFKVLAELMANALLMASLFGCTGWALMPLLLLCSARGVRDFSFQKSKIAKRVAEWRQTTVWSAVLGGVFSLATVGLTYLALSVQLGSGLALIIALPVLVVQLSLYAIGGSNDAAKSHRDPPKWAWGLVVLYLPVLLPTFSLTGVHGLLMALLGSSPIVLLVVASVLFAVCVGQAYGGLIIRPFLQNSSSLSSSSEHEYSGLTA